MDSIIEAIKTERARQDAKWGEQNHPSVSPLCAIAQQYGDNPIAHHLPITADIARRMCDFRFKQGNGSWADIAVEELCEAIEVGNTPELCRAELVQLAAVCVAWIESIDRNGR